MPYTSRFQHRLLPNVMGLQSLIRKWPQQSLRAKMLSLKTISLPEKPCVTFLQPLPSLSTVASAHVIVVMISKRAKLCSDSKSCRLSPSSRSRGWDYLKITICPGRSTTDSIFLFHTNVMVILRNGYLPWHWMCLRQNFSRGASSQAPVCQNRCPVCLFQSWYSSLEKPSAQLRMCCSNRPL